MTGIGGGTLRDVLLGQTPVFWIREPAYLVVCLIVASLVFFTAHIPQSRYRVLLWFDALGLALFAVTGAERATHEGSGPVAAVAVGVITATFGGIIRDVIGGEKTVVTSREVYVTAALIAACVFVTFAATGLRREVALACGLLTGFAVRGMALHYGWSLPRYRARAARPFD